MLAPNVRYPDVSFVPWSEVPGDELPEEAIWSVVPALAVEVLSPSNTAAEIDRKIAELFELGTKLVWVIDPPTESAAVYTKGKKPKRVGPGDVLEGGKVLPGFRLPLSDLFAAVKRKRK
jgi:Uma2 family endonuclease